MKIKITNKNIQRNCLIGVSKKEVKGVK